MNIINKRHIFFVLSGILILGSIAAMAVFGLKPGIDFAGGTLWEIHGDQISVHDLRNFFNERGARDATVFPSERGNYLFRLGHISENDHQRYLTELKQEFSGIEEVRFETIGPTISGELTKKAYIAIALVLLGISLYIAFAFRKVSRPISSWKYGVITLITLFHDIIIPAGMVAVLGKKFGVEVDTNFVVALLVVMGFSVHDTIVVFDRIRENLLLSRDRNLPLIINESIKQTFARSVNTSLTLILVLLSLFFFGPLTMEYFILAILVGTIVGTYSSIFIASPLLLYF